MNLLLFAVAGLKTTEEGLFPFPMPLLTPRNAADLSAWLERPAGKVGFVRVAGGRLAVPMASGEMRPIHFWGTNLCAGGCFPTRE